MTNQMQRFDPELFRARLNEVWKNMPEIERDFPALAMDPAMVNPVVAVLADSLNTLRKDIGRARIALAWGDNEYATEILSETCCDGDGESHKVTTILKAMGF